MKIRVDLILPNPEQPRTTFDEAEMRGLAESIREHGLLNPVSVEGPIDGQYILLDGERRWRAHQMLGLEEIEAAVRAPDHSDRLVLALVGNLQRKDMNPVEEAHAFLKLRQAGLTLEEIAAQVGVHPATVSNRFLLLEMDEPIQHLIAGKRLANDPALLYALRDIQDTGQRIRLAVMAAENKLSGNAVRYWAKRYGQKSQAGKSGRNRAIPAYTRAIAAGGHWNAIAQVGARPGDARLAEAAEATCRDCPLYEEADDKTCRECPLVDLLRRMQ